MNGVVKYHRGDDFVAVIGPGPAGILAALVAMSAGATVALLGTKGDSRRLDLARELGVRFTLDVDEPDAVREVRLLPRGNRLSSSSRRRNA